MILCLNVLVLFADFKSDGRQFQIFGPRKDTHFCPEKLLRNGISNLNLKKIRSLAGRGIKIIRSILKTKILIYQSKANLDAEILFGSITHLQDSQIRKMSARNKCGNENCTLHYGA